MYALKKLTHRDINEIYKNGELWLFVLKIKKKQDEKTNGTLSNKMSFVENEFNSWSQHDNFKCNDNV